ncbi:TIGR04222 domain-containing membrane protein [Microcoleus sp. FACHB-1515]|uniref:TIGR04222 domain-containing membrane protein n=1 Tax=Cyanophyceae TaxID=3028117 RepID=UPI001687E6ED|nr:TIGR04222 domain-containing membrane protein [Microcoleus sp. FACHB-1515]MBD2092426.1 TIGR04222 domain-containing membrane protein [Microcoleus sp. FACHB-1515]
MNTQQIELYQRLQAFALDEAKADFPFSARLAHENNWSIAFAKRAIEEYKKFAFLAVIAGHPVTPSDQVDQVWHLHLTYTRSYWDEFCPQVLQMPLHHGPTKGGAQEQNKFNDLYARTIASYRTFFGTPPADLWPAPHLRFGRDCRFVRLNTQQNWVIPKPDWSALQQQFGSLPAAIGWIAIAVLLTSCTAATLPNPLNFVGWQFLLFYTIAVVSAFGVTWLWRSRVWRSTVESVESNLHPYEVAYLASSAERAIATSIASLIQRQHLQPVEESGRVAVRTPLLATAHPLEAAVISSLEEDPDRPVWALRWRTESAAQAATAAIAQHLQQLTLLITNQQVRLLRLTMLPIAAVLLLGIVKIGVGISRDKPVGYLMGLCWLTAMLGWTLLELPRSTPSGDRYLQTLREQVELRSLNPDDLDAFLLRFALDGRSVLAGSSLAALWQAAPQSTSTSLSTDSGTAAGCGGAGCGGCGGCGGCSG